jgi:hypothetical protein
VQSPRGLRSSLAVIPERVGQPGFVTEADLQMYVAAGNECVPHGPNRPGYLNGSLFDAWPTNAERVADVLGVIQYLDDRGLITENGKREYVWPTGRYLENLSDDSLLYALMDLGITTGFGTTENAFQKFRTDLISSSNPYRMALNCVGHTWSITDEAANVTNVIARIQGAVDAARGQPNPEGSGAKPPSQQHPARPCAGLFLGDHEWNSSPSPARRKSP